MVYPISRPHTHTHTHTHMLLVTVSILCPFLLFCYIRRYRNTGGKVAFPLCTQLDARLIVRMRIPPPVLNYVHIYFFLYGSTALDGPGPPRFVEVSWSHTFETHHSR
jgi:hypothetical protein